MPCVNATEVVKIWLDTEERLRLYTLQKQTCERGVGEPSLLLAKFAGRGIEEILAMHYRDCMQVHLVYSSVDEFLVRKHFDAVQSALRVYMGMEPGGPDDSCLAASIAIEEDTIRIECHLSPRLIPEDIQSCGPCPFPDEAP